MKYDRTEDSEIIDSALDTLDWQRREIDRLTAELAEAVERIEAQAAETARLRAAKLACERMLHRALKTPEEEA